MEQQTASSDDTSVVMVSRLREQADAIEILDRIRTQIAVTKKAYSDRMSKLTADLAEARKRVEAFEAGRAA